MAEKKSWPEKVAIDFSDGLSRIASGVASLDASLSGGLASIRDNLSKKLTEAGDVASHWLMSITDGSSSEGSDEEGTIDMSVAKNIVELARSKVGNAPYHWGSNGTCSKSRVKGQPLGGYSHEKEGCFDCSGLAEWAYKKATGKAAPFARPTGTMFGQGTKVLGPKPTAKELKGDKILPGDLVFFSTPSDIHHVGICVGENTGKYIDTYATGKMPQETSLAGRSDIAGVRRYLPISAYEETGSNDARGVNTLDGYTLPCSSGYSGNEETINEQGQVPSTGQKVSIWKFAKLGQEYRDYYITMRWNYVKWKWDGHTTSADNKQITWMHDKPRIVLVTNERTGKSIYAVALESGPAPWTGTAGGKDDSDQKKKWGEARHGNPSGYTGRSAGFPPAARKALGVKQQTYGKGGDVLTFQWAKDQSVKPGPCTLATPTLISQSNNRNIPEA